MISKQLLRSGTSIGANVEEAGAAQSKKDFLSKMSIASKEARETKYWLRLLRKSDLTTIQVDVHMNEIESIIDASVKSSLAPRFWSVEAVFVSFFGLLAVASLLTY